jgi:hypothetical protein
LKTEDRSPKRHEAARRVLRPSPFAAKEGHDPRVRARMLALPGGKRLHRNRSYQVGGISCPTFQAAVALGLSTCPTRLENKSPIQGWGFTLKLGSDAYILLTPPQPTTEGTAPSASYSTNSRPSPTATTITPTPTFNTITTFISCG